MEGNNRIAYCGIYCPMCSFVVACETKDRAHLSAIPSFYDHLKDQSLEDVEPCAGCRVQTDRCHCDMKPCAESKGHFTCADCEEFPCDKITAFGFDGAPHHKEALQNLYRIREIGYDAWILEMDSKTKNEQGLRMSWYYRPK